MAKQKFTAVEREAIWIAHEKKCAYTRELIDVNSFHIDHILPESLAERPEEFDAVKEQYGLADDFNLFGYDNVLPCKASANLQKSSLLFEPAAIHYFLSIATSKKAEITHNIEKINARRSKGKILILLQSLLESGQLSVEEVADLLENYSEKPQEIFQLIVGMRFADESEIKTLARSEIDQLRDRPIKLGKNDHIEGITFENANNDRVLIKTCREYDKAIKAGYHAGSNFDLKLSAFFEHQCGLLSALEVATMATHSYINDPRAGVTDVHLIPFSLFPNVGDEQLEFPPTASYQELIDKGILFVKRVKNNLLVIESEGMGQQLVEVARADFNCDGIEDILLFEYCYATHGTLGYGDIKILTRKATDSLFEEATPCKT